MKGENCVSCCIVLTSMRSMKIQWLVKKCFAEVLNRLFMDDDMGMYEVDELDNSWEPDFE